MGLIPRALREIQERINTTPNTKFTVSYGFSELYLDKLYNLLNESKESDGQQMKLIKLRDTKDIVTPLSAMIKSAKKRRVTARTDANNFSSRSHAFFQFKIVSKEDTGVDIVERMGTITFVDLAGSEKMSEVLLEPQKKKENLFINKSLTSLRDVLIALANKEAHIPYRNSKLTQILQPYLGQEAKTLIVVNICPNSSYYYQTKNSLDFAKAIPRIKNPDGFRKNLVVTPKFEWKEDAFQEDQDRLEAVQDLNPPNFSRFQNQLSPFR
jgi:kinesin family member C1